MTLFSSDLVAQASPPAFRIDSVFSDLNGEGSPGCALGIVRGGDLVYGRGYGYANLDYDIPIEPTTVFGIASMSKQFTAAAVLLASQGGHLSLDDDIRMWLPEFPEYERPITVRHLVHHTSGIRDDAQLRAVGNLPDLSPGQTVELLARQRALNFPPGEEYLYSNSGYVLLAIILERATGRSLRDFAQEQIFDPLGMEDTRFKPANAVVSRRATGYTNGPGGLVVGSDPAYEYVGAGGVISSVLDFSRWITALAGNQPGDGFREAMLERGTLATGQAVDYAFGLNLWNHRGLPAITHGGAGNGYRTGFTVYPNENLGVVVLCNLSSVDAQGRVDQVAEVLLEDRLGPEEPKPSVPFVMMHPQPAGDPLELSSKELGELAGRYYAPELDVIFHVSVEGEGLRIGPEGWMRPMASTSRADLFTDGRGWAQIHFARDERGAVDGFIMDIGRVRGLIMERLPEGHGIDSGGESDLPGEAFIPFG
jgi:CubicO group peptidase (beta-lactamase class C family)